MSLNEERIEKILDMWETHSLEDIGKEVGGISKQRVQQIVYRLRKNGLPVPKKEWVRKSFDWKGFVEKNKKRYEV